MHAYLGGVWLVRLVFLHGLALIYLVAFVSTLRQFPALLGERGLTPVARFVARVSFVDAPSLFHLSARDSVARAAAWTGVVLSLLLVAGVADVGPAWWAALPWLALWALYLSFVNVGQRFYGFGWESMLLEAGFFAALLGPMMIEPSPIPILLLRWMLFRTEFGAGLIKLRHDRCWRDLTCLDYHYQTQPLPNPISRAFHFLPKPIHRASVAGSHAVQLVAPFFLFAPQPVAAIAGAVIIVHQLWLVASGNYSWLNWLTVVLGVTALDDRALTLVLPVATPLLLQPRTLMNESVLQLVAAIAIALSVEPALNLASKHQKMNCSFNPLHLINAYGAFGSVSKERYEVIVEGTSAATPDDPSAWRPYEFKAKPGNIMRRPRLLAPYHLRLDWLMWFLPFSVQVTPGGVLVRGYSEWFLVFLERLLDNDAATLALLADNPFPDAPPRFIRARYYRYRFATRREHRETGAYWQRTLIGDYLPPVSRAQLLHTEI
ncbi:MAG TPA: lipase maturation factor family protein [Myxococcota bacterium]|jgi:hypothetical protein